MHGPAIQPGPPGGQIQLATDNNISSNENKNSNGNSHNNDINNNDDDDDIYFTA